MTCRTLGHRLFQFLRRRRSKCPSLTDAAGGDRPKIRSHGVPDRCQPPGPARADAGGRHRHACVRLWWVWWCLCSGPGGETGESDAISMDPF